MKIASALCILIGAILVYLNPGLARGGQGVGRHADDICATPGGVLSIAVGKPTSTLRGVDSSEVRALASLASTGGSSYVFKPSKINYSGAIEFEVSCPRLVSVTPKNGRIDSLEIDFTSDDPSSLERALALADYWRRKFSEMSLDRGPSDQRAYVVSIDAAREYFNLIHPSWGETFGKALGVWMKGSEVLGIGIECWNISSLGEPGKYIYVVQITVASTDAKTTRGTIKSDGEKEGRVKGVD